MSAADADRQTLIDLSKAWMRAWIDRDRATLEALLDDDFVLTVSSRPDLPVRRDEWLAMTERYVCTDFRHHWIEPRLFGDVAVVASMATQAATVGPVDRSGAFFLTDVWRRRDGRWRVAARHSSRPEASTTGAAVGR